MSGAPPREPLRDRQNAAAGTVSETRPDGAPISLLKVLRILRSAGRALIAQAALHGQLAGVEWAEEKSRLSKLIATALVGSAFMLCILLFAGILVLAVTWDTAYRIPSVIALIAVYGVGAVVAWRRFQALSALGEESFAATREELAADIALIKSKL